MRKQWKQWLTLFFWAPQSLQMVNAAMKLKDAYSLEGKLCHGLSMAPLSMEFSKQEYGRGLPFPTPGDHPNPEIKPTSPVSPALAGRFFLPLSHLGSQSFP